MSGRICNTEDKFEIAIKTGPITKGSMPRLANNMVSQCVEIVT
jgi:hypothetical protein